MAVQYDNIAKKYSKMEGPVKRHVSVPTFNDLVGDVSGKSCLDLACGAGYFTRILADQHSKEVVGVDISSRILKEAKAIERKEKKGIKYFCEDVTKLDLKTKFDVITAVYMLNYAKTEEELSAMIASAYRHLKPRGVFCGVTINPGLKPKPSFEYGYQVLNDSNKNQEHRFKEGDKIRFKTDELADYIQFFCFYRSMQTYDSCFRKAGFKSLKWVSHTISGEGMAEFGRKYWASLNKNPDMIGFIATK